MALHNKYADVPLRIRSWGVIICVFAVAIFHPYAMCLFTLWVSFQALTELGRLLASILPIGVLPFPCYKDSYYGAVPTTPPT